VFKDVKPPDLAVDPESERLEDFLDTPLSRRTLPSRLLNWADRRRVGRFRDLLAWSPERLARERNVGRETIRETRWIIERETRRTWEDLSERLGGQAAVEDPVPPPRPAPGWDHLARLLNFNRAQAAVPLDALALPTRLRRFAARAGLRTLGDLLRLRRADLVRVPKLGQVTIAQGEAAVYAFLLAPKPRPRDPPEPDATTAAR
jgi:DNA-directed RNA polymerase alpha subunit